MSYKNPRLNSSVWVIVNVDGFPYTLSKQIVAMKNKEAFITEEVLYGGDSLIKEVYCIYNFEDYGKTWFKTKKEGLEYIKKEIFENYYKRYYPNGSYEIEKGNNDFYYFEWNEN